MKKSIVEMVYFCKKAELVLKCRERCIIWIDGGELSINVWEGKSRIYFENMRERRLTMGNNTHDPAEYIKGIQQILISDKKRIGFLFGAGSSSLSREDKTLTIPAIGEMTNMIIQYIGGNNLKFKSAFDEIKKELGERNFNIEKILSNIEQKCEVIDGGTLNDLNKADFELLRKQLKEKIKELVSIHKNINEGNVSKLVHSTFAEWVGQADRKYGVEIFTTNYDYLFEIGLEHNNIPYYDGFSGSYEPFFNPESVEDICFVSDRTKLWKIHGSLGWHFKEFSKKIVRHNSDQDNLLIYPSMLKYNDSKKQPYVSFMDRLSDFIKQDDSILFICGYSFNDEHINEIILSALKTNTMKYKEKMKEKNLVSICLDLIRYYAKLHVCKIKFQYLE
jgi:hypothetical protein